HDDVLDVPGRVRQRLTARSLRELHHVHLPVAARMPRAERAEGDAGVFGHDDLGVGEALDLDLVGRTAVEEGGERDVERRRQRPERLDGRIGGAALERAAAGAAAISIGGALPAVARAGVPKRGGRLRIGMVGGGPAETLDPHKSVSFIDAARAKNLFDKLTEFKPDMSVEYQLA